MTDAVLHNQSVAPADASDKKKRWQLAVGLGLLSMVLCATLVAPLPISHDSVGFALALDHYDVTIHQPHPPGYFLYIMLGRLAKYVVGDAWTALWLLGIIGVGLATTFTVCAGCEIAGTDAGGAAGVIALTSPLLLQSAARGETYALSCALAAFIGWRILRLRVHERKQLWEVVLVSAVMALFAGLRASDAIFLMPLWAYGMFALRWRGLAIGTLVGALCTAAWALPMVALQPGGLPAIREASSMLSSGWVTQFSPFVAGWPALSRNLVDVIMAFTVMVGFGWLSIPFLPRLRGRVTPILWWVCIVWIVPDFLFLLLGHIGKAYHVLFTGPALWLVGGIAAAEGLRTRNERVERLVIVTVLVLGFLITARVQTNQYMREWQTAIALASRLPADATVALAPNAPSDQSASNAWDFRHTMYYVPQMLTVLFPPDSTAHIAPFNAGRNRLTGQVPVPVVLSGIQYLLLPGQDFLKSLPQQAQPVEWSIGQMKLYVVPVDPNEALILGPGDRITFQPGKDPPPKP